MVDTVSKWIGSHSYIEVGVAQPLDGFFNVGYSSQSHLTWGEKQNDSICIREYRYKEEEAFTCHIYIIAQ